MTNIDIAFGRALLTQAHDLLRKHFPQMKMLHMQGWTYKVGRDHFEFHYKDFYWHGSAGNAYEARYHGWMAWLKQKGIEV